MDIKIVVKDSSYELREINKRNKKVVSFENISFEYFENITNAKLKKEFVEPILEAVFEVLGKHYTRESYIAKIMKEGEIDYEEEKEV